MNIHIDATRFRSHAEMIQEAKDRHKRFELAARRAVMKIATPEPVLEPTFVSKTIPLWEQFGLNFDAHVVEWHLRRANPALAYLKDRCDELDVSYRKVIGGRVLHEIVGVRHLLMWEIYEKFDLSFPQIGRMFGGRDHTTVIYAVRKIEAQLSIWILILAAITYRKF